MKAFFPAAALAALAALGGCASAPAETVAASDKGMICTRETPIGSNFPVTKCRTPEQVAAEKAAAERAQNTIQQSATQRPAGQ